jgi:hypothetical protein
VLEKNTQPKLTTDLQQELDAQVNTIKYKQKQQELGERGNTKASGRMTSKLGCITERNK